MATVNVTIDGREIAAQPGQTVLEAAQSAGIDIPTLCHHPALEPIGACRICLVEIEKLPALQPACTFQVTSGIVIHTESDKVIESRRFVLQLIFSERNHFCMYCQMSGDCELQDLAYRYGLDSWLYPRPYAPLPVMIASLVAAAELAISGASPWGVVLPAMGAVHALIGIGEGLITVAVLAFLRTTRPDLLTLRQATSRAGGG